MALKLSLEEIFVLQQRLHALSQKLQFIEQNQADLPQEVQAPILAKCDAEFQAISAAAAVMTTAEILKEPVKEEPVEATEPPAEGEGV
ncbi:MAG: hypothetical protein WC547_09705 [Candidatus Omnitrophota bacterium]